MVLEKTLESPLDSRENKLEISPEYSSEGLILKLQYFDYLMWRADWLKKTLMMERIEGRRWREQQSIKWLDRITDSMHMNLGKLW